MIQRFQIEDLVVQDSSGVVFRAFDTESNQTVAVRRFFPFGASGGGLREDEQTAYSIAVGRLATVTHPALRAVICGGCDPVDGMPFIATEWIEGPRLESIIGHGPVDPLAAAHLLSQALEVCELLSEVLAEEAVWVETSLQAIVIGAEGTGRGVTFWISPLQWLGNNGNPRGLESIIALTEEIMGWTEQSVADHADHGLGSWLKWLRGRARTTTLREARENLAAAIGVAPPAPVQKLIHQAKRPPVVTRKKKASFLPIVIGAAAALVAIALGGYFLIKWNSTASASDSDIDRMTGTQVAAVQKQGNVFTVGDRDLLLARKNSEVQLEGQLAEVRFSDNGKGATLYLEFSKPSAKDEPRGYIMRKDLTAELSLESLRKFIGKNVRLSGKVSTPSFRSQPEIEIKNQAAIQQVP